MKVFRISIFLSEASSLLESRFYLRTGECYSQPFYGHVQRFVVPEGATIQTIRQVFRDLGHAYVLVEVVSLAEVFKEEIEQAQETSLVTDR